MIYIGGFMLEEIKIENLIYEIRGKQVMLDSDLAKLYGCKNGTKTINQAAKRHLNKFPERFMFQLSRLEYNNILRSIYKIFAICFYRRRCSYACYNT